VGTQGGEKKWGSPEKRGKILQRGNIIRGSVQSNTARIIFEGQLGKKQDGKEENNLPGREKGTDLQKVDTYPKNRWVEERTGFGCV